ncbi:MAG: hypothetical protein IJX07_02925 [Bacillales bacterium]|nr:hypothetical protein [Bacillales bacterium]
MQQKFMSNGCVYDVEIFRCDNTDIVRFYEMQNEQYGEKISDLVIATPSYGFLLIKYIGGDAVLTGTLNRDYFCEEMVTDIMDFVEKNLPCCRNIYLPYHIDFVTIESSEEYNGEY